VDLSGNPLSAESINTYIPQLMARGVTVTYDAPQEVTFPDPNLEAAIRDALNKPTGSIYASDLELLTTLDAGERSITNLIGLEYCVNLQERLDLRDNNISDISPLTGLTNLQHLIIWGNNISDISPLAGLTNLIVLNMVTNNISDISPLAGLTNLIVLKLEQNNINDITLLANLTNLEVLWLSRNNISDLSPLAGLTNLQELELHQNNISDITLLANLTNLEVLKLQQNNISDISPLAGLTNLQYLVLWGNNISDISPLVANSGLSDGDTVNLSGNPLSTTSVDVYIPQLEARGVTVVY
jgi:Leucine-rich repeat (LRR) protein